MATPSTPKRRPPTSNSTPARPHSTGSHDFHSGILETVRQENLKDVGQSIPEVDVDLFLEHLLPPLRDGVNINSVVSFLVDQCIVIPDIHGGKLKDFATDPINQDDREDKVFASLGPIFNATIRGAISSGCTAEQTFVLALVPSIAPKSLRGNTNRPDAFFILKDAEDKAKHARREEEKKRWWYDIALSTEFKKGTSVDDRNDNVGKIMYSIQQVMTLDPCRRFTFGITVENTNMRLWFCSRAIPLVSKAFNFANSPSLLARIFLSIGFANKEELGWDPTIIPMIQDGQRNYQIRIGQSTFETEKMLSDCAADALISGATRVWRANCLETGQSVIVKDFWVEEDRDLEHEIYEKILRDVEAEYGADARRQVGMHLLTPFKHWLVEVDGKEDHTTQVIMNGFEPSLEDEFVLKITQARKKDVKKRSVGPRVASDLVKQGDKAPFARRARLLRKRHYRVAFEEIAETIHSLKQFSDAFIVLRDTAKALYYIHHCGWVHRDLGIGNLYLYRGRGLIGDLEYAKHRNSNVTHEVRTGRPDCMASEAILHRYLYAPDNAEGDTGIEAFMSAMNEKAKNIRGASMAAERPVLPSNPRHNTPKPRFNYNGIHDLESLWWTAIWILFFHNNDDDEATKVEGYDTYEPDGEIATKLFPRNEDVSCRTEFFEDSEVYDSYLFWLPHWLEDIKQLLNAVRKMLHDKYKQFEATLQESREVVFTEEHARFQQMMHTCAIFANTFVPKQDETITPQLPEHHQDEAPLITKTQEIEDSSGRTSILDTITEEAVQIGVANLALEDERTDNGDSDEDDEQEVERQLVMVQVAEDASPPEVKETSKLLEESKNEIGDGDEISCDADFMTPWPLQPIHS